MTGFVVIADATLQNVASIDRNGNQSIGSIPAGATQITGSSGNVANAIATATLSGVAGKTTFITGFAVTGTGATLALAVAVTVSGVVGGTMTYTTAAAVGILVANVPLVIQFMPPLPASAVNTAIVVTCAALGAGNTNSTAVAYGFQI